MTLTQLEYVVAIAEHQNFTVAAEKSFVTQPTLSMQIHKLEKELEVEIFDRRTQPIKPTLIGRRIIAQAKVILSETKRMEQMIREEKGLLEGDFIIGVIPTVLPTLVPMFYKTFRKNHPKANLIIRELLTDEIINGLAEGTLDFGIAVTPLHEDQITEKPLYNEPMVAYIPPSHSLYSQQNLNPEDLEIEDLLLLKEGNCFRNNVLNLCDRPQLRNQPIKLDSGNLDTLVKLANEGYGMTILPLLQTEDLPKDLQKNIRYFSNPIPTRQISLVYHHSNLRMSFEESLSKTIQSVMRGKIFVDKTANVISPLLSMP